MFTELLLQIEVFRFFELWPKVKLPRFWESIGVSMKRYSSKWESDGDYSDYSSSRRFVTKLLLNIIDTYE